MICYLYKPDTKEFVRTETVFPDPMNKSSYLLPPDATMVVPPVISDDKHIAVWQDTRWITMEDHRQKMNARGVKYDGTPYWMPGDTYESEARYMDTIGPLPPSAKTTQPEKDLATLKSEKSMEINAGTSRGIYAGFDYTDGFHYTYDRYDQINHAAAAARAAADPTFVYVTNGHRPDDSTVARTFTAAEFITFFGFMEDHKDALLAINASRNLAVENAKTPAEVEAA